MVFHKQLSASDSFFDKRREVMNKTIEPSTSRLIGCARGLEPGRTVKLVAQWQSGPQTLEGMSSASCVLVLPRLPSLQSNPPDA